MNEEWVRRGTVEWRGENENALQQSQVGVMVMVIVIAVVVVVRPSRGRINASGAVFVRVYEETQAFLSYE